MLSANKFAVVSKCEGRKLFWKTMSLLPHDGRGHNKRRRWQ
jgi:hypothetical protein